MIKAVARFMWRVLKRTYLFFLGFGFALVCVFLGYYGLEYSSTDEFCEICHVHPHSTMSWKKSGHYKNTAGMIVHCVDCHLPPGGVQYLVQKARLGIRDGWGYLMKDPEEIDWDTKSSLEHAVTFTFEESCRKCHPDLYSVELTPKGVEAHEYYLENVDRIRCLNCHIDTGHYQEKPVEQEDLLAAEKIEKPVYPSYSGAFDNYTETLPGSGVTFNMIAIPDGSFVMGSPESEAFREQDEGPQVDVNLSPFWMGEIEVTWQEYDAYYAVTSNMGKSNELTATDYIVPEGVDAITGPTPPYGSPDQGWGKGLRPAITMTFHAAEKYCEWLSDVTGHTYRLPTEAEWEYACRAGARTAYSFGNDPKLLDKYAWHAGNSQEKYHPVGTKKPNTWGVYDMHGNVAEWVLDGYAPDAYAHLKGKAAQCPLLPAAKIHPRVIRGGSYRDAAKLLRCAARGQSSPTFSERDPQFPKSIWWHTDAQFVGFRVVRPLRKPTGKAAARYGLDKPQQQDYEDDLLRRGIDP